MSRTAVVILNYNGEKLLQQFLPSVIQHSGQAEIIVVDNRSSDGSVLLLQQSYPRVRIISLDQNYGFCGGYNRGLRQVSADYFVLLNNDVEVTTGWLMPMIGLLDNNPDIAIVQPKVLSYVDRHKFEHAGAAGGFIDALGYPFCRGRIFDTVEEDQGQYDDEREIFWATGACMMIRAEIFNRFHGFDEDFFAHMEEIDLSWKTHRANKKVFYTGRSTIFHVGAGTLAYNHPTKIYLNFKNGLSLLVKHLGAGELLVKIPIRILLDWVAGLQFLVRGYPKNFVAILRAHGNFFLGINHDLTKRRALKRILQPYDNRMVYKRSIVIDYFFRGRKSFKDLN